MNSQGIFQSLGIRARVLVLALLPIAMVVTLLGYHLTSSRLADAERGLAERAALIARNLALASEFPLFSQNIPLVNDTLQRVVSEPEIRWAAVWDAQRRVLLSRGDSPASEKANALVEALQGNRPLPSGYYSAPIRVELLDVTDFREEYGPLAGDGGPDQSGQLLGYALLEVASDRLVSLRAEIVRSSMLITLAGLTGSLLFALLIGNSITEPVSRLIGTVRELRTGKLDARVQLRAGGEIGRLEEDVNQMAATLQAAQQSLRERVDAATLALRRTVNELEIRNRELEEARELALRAGEERTEFLARMSHEIRTPLNAIVGFTRLLQDDSASAARDEHVRTIQRAAEQLLHVINDILQFIRLDADADELERLEFNVAEVLEDAVAMLAPMADEKGLELVLLLHSDLPPRMWGDPSRLSQIMINLLNNALKFTAQGQVVVEALRLKERDGEDRLEISVSDTGIGLDADEQARVFEAFAQSESSVTRRFGGTGLGLSIARRLVELMGGEIGVQSQKGEGARFSLRLPCGGCSAAAPIDAGGPLAGKRVLVYDTNPLVRRSLRSLLASWGIQVFNTGSWLHALELMEGGPVAQQIDLVIFGLSPAQQDTAEVNRYLQALRRRHTGPILLLTGSDAWAPPDAIRHDPGVSWSTKPARRRTLRRLLDQMTGADRDHEAPPHVGRGGEAPLLSDMQILVAEDNELNRQLLRHVLEAEGADIDEAVTGRAAVHAARRGGYDVILMDLHMPELDGAEAAGQIRSSLGDRTPPILALTADVFGSSNLPGAEEHFDDWLLKPIDPQVLLGKLAGLRTGPPTQRRALGPPGRRDTVPASLRLRYLEETVDLITRLRKTDNADRGALSQLVHDLKGMAGLSGDISLTELSARLDTGLIDEDPGAWQALLDALRGRASEFTAQRQAEAD